MAVWIRNIGWYLDLATHLYWLGGNSNVPPDTTTRPLHSPHHGHRSLPCHWPASSSHYWGTQQENLLKKKIMRFLLPPQVYRKSCNQNQLIDPLTWLGTAVAIITKVGSLSWSLTLNILHAEFRLLCLIQQQSSIVGAHSYKRGLKAMTWFMCKRAAKHRENFPLSEWQIER